ncbi:hypothetical protein QTP88_007421 [Uroleucon formosanum]
MNEIPHIQDLLSTEILKIKIIKNLAKLVIKTNAIKIFLQNIKTLRRQTFYYCTVLELKWISKSKMSSKQNEAIRVELLIILNSNSCKKKGDRRHAYQTKQNNFKRNTSKLVRKSLYCARKKLFPKLLQTLEDTIDILSAEEDNIIKFNNEKCCHISSDKNFILFTCKANLNLLCDSTHIFGNGAFCMYLNFFFSCILFMCIFLVCTYYLKSIHNLHNIYRKLILQKLLQQIKGEMASGYTLEINIDYRGIPDKDII